jgi:salicylate hydroxylase
VFEQARRLSETGAGVQLAPNAIRPLRRLGLQAALSEHAVRITATEFRGWDGGLIAVTQLEPLCEALFGAPCYALHRAHLQNALLAAAGPDRVRLGRRLVRIEENGPGVRLRFADGSGHLADLVVGADGIHSVVRDALAGDAPVYSGLRAFRGLIPAARLPIAAREPVVRLWLGPGRHVVCYPVSGARLISFAAIAPAAGPVPGSRPATGDRTELAAAFEGWAAPVVEVLRAADSLRQWALHDREPLPKWVANRVTVLGDAAHPMLPFLAHGANQAIEDAVALAGCLAGAHRDDVPARLARYEALRAPRTAAVQRVSRGNARLLHLADGEPQRARDRAMSASGGLRERAWLYGYDAGRAI